MIKKIKNSNIDKPSNIMIIKTLYSFKKRRRLK